jgi:anhydro-N-acetylmuramic acid kinase
MTYRAIGLMSGSSLDGLDIVFAEFEVNGQQWNYNIQHAGCYAYDDIWTEKLQHATLLSAPEYMQLHADYGHLLGKLVKQFIADHQLDYKVQLIGSHGHTTFHTPSAKMTHQLGDGAALAAATGINVVSDLRNMDVALGGQGAPIVPIGEKLLLGDYQYFLNIGGIANISANTNPYVAFDICPANRVMNMLTREIGKPYDDGGSIARGGQVKDDLLLQLNSLGYYQLPYPKSLANDFGTDIVYPLVKKHQYSVEDALCTYVEHIALQLKNAIVQINNNQQIENSKLLATGGGVFNNFLIERMKTHLPGIDIVVPDAKLVEFKEALIMAFIALLRWREENNVLSSVTGAVRDSVGGAVWSGE